MTQEQIHQINIRHTKNVDKFYRMFGGLSSNLLYYKYNTLYLKIKVSGRWGKDPVTTCRQIARDWQRGNEELNDSIHYKVHHTFKEIPATRCNKSMLKLKENKPQLLTKKLTKVV